MNLNKCEGMAAKRATNAKNGTLKHGGETYVLTFCHRDWIYRVKNQAGEYVVNINTKSIRAAQKFLRHFLEN